jgi:hypothetical protein
MTHSSQYCKAEYVSLQRSIGEDRRINERWMVTPEWIESIIVVRPTMSLEHCHIATLIDSKLPSENEV